ncbi:MAG TPA: DUF4345 domain-containing protein [Caulobacteraceae bacterium]|nr:DUF4345 domain-containing protein [Caulobacteraceae bacterium]
MERRLLQICVAIAGLVPVAGGVAGVLWGPGGLGEEAQGPLDSHFRYLSGLLAAIGVAYWTTVPDIEKEGARFGLLTLIMVAGGFARALGMLIAGPPGAMMSAAMAMELIITPLLYLWQARVQRLAARPAVDAAPARG